MQLRVATQGAVVGMLTLGCCYQLYKRLTFKDELHHPEDKKGR
ncbi:hypothetical protein BIW11_12720 [Tropilaelaps mercedesae]|uniref:Uncharacterized protein n=1 Tax=Tropilaelaps mercedesae TaxID=418985 RepID=A0A1V9X546_9ACAR|nr:hypothetical protein BIW11_12720 [Tropilaelaps mercedesae]